MSKMRIAITGVMLTGVMLSCSSFDLMPPRGGWMWVAFDNDTFNRMYIIDPTTGITKKKLPGCGVGGEVDGDARVGCMVWGDGKLWATGVRDDYEPYWCEIDQGTGGVIEYFDAPSGSWGGGITWDGSRLWYTDIHNFYTINPADNSYEWQFDTGWHGDEYSYHSNYGLAWDGGFLWSIGSQEYESGDVYLYQFDVDKKAEIRRVFLDYINYGDVVNGLTYDGEAFWLTTYKSSSRIYRISPVDGSSLGYIVPRTVSPTGEETIIDKPFAVAFEFPSE
jgi:hypothetical protein